MKACLMLDDACAALAIGPALAQTGVATTPTQNADGSTTTAKEVNKEVKKNNTGTVAYQGAVEMGRPVSGGGVLRDAPDHPKYHWAHLEDERVVVDDHHHVVAVYTN